MTTVIKELPLLLQGVAVTLQISVLVIIAGSIIGIFGGLGLLYGPLWLRALLRGYVDIVRGLPLLVTIFIIFYVPPALDIEVSGFAAVAVALSIFAGAHISEIVRGAVSAVHEARRRRESARTHLLAPHLVRHPAPGLARDHPAMDEHGYRDGQGELARLSGQRQRAAVSNVQGRGTYRRGDAVVHRRCAPLLCDQLCLVARGLWLERRIRYTT